MHIAIAVVLVAVGTVVFHFLSPWWWTPIASNWGYIDDTIMITFWITGAVFVAVLFFTAYCIWRFRHRPGHRAAYEPESKKLEWWLTIFTTVGVMALLSPGLLVWGQFVTVPADASEVEVMAQQWRWMYRFPGKDGILGTSGAQLISTENPFGLNADDPNAKDDVLIDDAELRLPIDKPVKMMLRSIDVLHDFYVPQFRAKMDLVPGMVTHFWVTPTRTGTFDVLCFELCGIGHYDMRGTVVVEEDAAFQAWLTRQPTFEKSMAQSGASPTEAANAQAALSGAAPAKAAHAGAIADIH